MLTLFIILALPSVVFLLAAIIGMIFCFARAAPPAPAQYLLNLLIWLDQGINALCGGSPDETISSACYRFGGRIPPKSALWWCAYKGVNLLFFWQADHCRMAYQSELERKHLPPDLQSAGAGPRDGDTARANDEHYTGGA